MSSNQTSHDRDQLMLQTLLNRRAAQHEITSPSEAEMIDAAPVEPGRPELREVLVTALRAGEIMLQNGANTSRAEETVYRIGRALGAEHLEVAVTPQALLASAVRDNQHRTLLRRISSGGVDLGRFAAVLDVSRAAAAGQLDLAATRAALERAAEQPRAYGVALTTLVVGMACACFIVLFGGGLWETVAVFLATTCTHLLRRWLHVLGLSRLLTTLLLASVGSALSLLILRLLLAAQLPLVAPGLAVVGVAVLLIPGVLLVSSIVDLFRGHIMAGWTRVVAALLEIAMIGAGVWLTLLLTGSNLDLSLGTPQISLVVALLAGLAAGGFAILFDVPQRALVAIVLIGAVGYSTRLMLLQFGLPLEVGSLVAGGFVGLAAEVLARRLRLPTSVFTIPAFIPLVPGVTAFRAVLAFADQRYLDGLGELIRALLIVTAIAIGIGAVTEIVRVRRAA